MVNGNTLAPTNSLVGPMLTDLYQITMVYAYWKVGRHNDHAVFDLFFRKNPFHGEYTVFAGLEEALAMVNTFKFTASDIAYLREVLPHAEDGFFTWLSTLDCSSVKVYAVKEGSIVFPRIPSCLLETPLLNLLNFASLITTNATRFKKAAGPDKKLLEFGLRRAQGPDGGLSASRYAYMAGFSGTSNVLAGKLHKIPIMGTHAHAFVQAHTTLDDVKVTMLDGKNFLDVVLKYRTELGHTQTNDGELAAFIAYAIAFPDAFLALVDTYDTLSSWVTGRWVSVLTVAICPTSRNAAVLPSSLPASPMIDYFKELNITASNDINEPVLNSLNEQRHEIDSYGIEPRIKLSQDVSKVTIPGQSPEVGKKMLCRNAFDELRRAYVTPSQVIPLHSLCWDGPNGGLVGELPTLEERRQYVTEQFELIREDVSVSNELYEFIHELWMKEYPVKELD
ncbi:Nicotinate phosphoribosyltransferase family [Phytophthora cactorum]|nr:Nicotinate phosphoribosyltransferase family [Phytophthora cactorum]